MAINSRGAKQPNDTALISGARLDAVLAVWHDLRLDNRHEAVALADGGVLGQVVRRERDGELRGKAVGGVDLQHVAPLCEARALRWREEGRVSATHTVVCGGAGAEAAPEGVQRKGVPRVQGVCKASPESARLGEWSDEAG